MSVEAAGSPSGQQFKCPSCNGDMAYDAASFALKCTYCRHTMPVPQGAQQGAAASSGGAVPAAAQGAGVHLPAGPMGGGGREIPLHEGLARAPKGFGTPVQSVQCRDCGATVNLGPNDRTASCTYCASSMVINVQTDPNVITPESLIPFQVPKDAASAKFKAWLSGLWFRPSNLNQMARLEQIVGVYVPFWTFDCDVHSQWTADRGWYYYETETYTEEENGQTVTRTREVQRTRWENAWGSRRDHFDDVLVCGSRGLPEKLVEEFSTFNTQLVVGYAPGYLAGWRAETYAVDLPAAWSRAQQKVVKTQESRCGGDVGGDTHSNLSVTNHFGNETFKHVLLPVYVAAYRYQGKPYRFLVNGQTGEVVGEAPYSFWKIFVAVAFVLAVIAAIVLVAREAEAAARPELSARDGYALVAGVAERAQVGHPRPGSCAALPARTVGA